MIKNEDINMNLAEEIFQRFGTIKRCRKCFLYTEKGVRLTDMYQQGGRSILGWNSSAYTVLKNVLDRGITGSFFTDFSNPNGREKSQLSRAISLLFGDERKVFTFSSKAAALSAALSLSASSTSVYRPWNPQPVNWRNVDCIVFEPAFPWVNDIFILAVKENLELNKLPENQSFLSAPLCAAITRSVYDLIKALQFREEKDWFIYDQIICTYWERKGPYLFPKVPSESYNDFILHCLDCNLVISPEYNQPSIIPFGADKGNFTKLKNSPFNF